MTQANAATIASRDLQCSFDSYFPPLLTALEKTLACERSLQVRISCPGNPFSACRCLFTGFLSSP